MRDACPPKYAEDCFKQYFQVKFKRSMLQVIIFEIDFLGNRQVISPVYLGPPSDSGNERVNAPLCPQFDQVVLIIQSRTGTNKTHVALENTYNLRQFIQTIFSEFFSDRGKVLIR